MISTEKKIRKKISGHRDELIQKLDYTPDGITIRREFGGDKYAVYNFTRNKHHLCWNCTNLLNINKKARRLVCNRCADKIVYFSGKKCAECRRSDRRMIQSGLTFRRNLCAICEYKSRTDVERR